MASETGRQVEVFHSGADLSADRLRAEHIYIDASVYRRLRFDWKGRALSEVADLARRRLLRVVVSDITRREVHARMREAWADVNKETQAARALLDQVGLPGAADTLADEGACLAAMSAAFEEWLTECRVVNCDTPPDLGVMMDDYFSGRPPFGPGKKKSEFPDALVVSALRGWCAKKDTSVYIVAEDGDLRECCVDGGPLIGTKSINEVLSHGKASAAIYAAIAQAVQDSQYLRDAVWDAAEYLDVRIEGGYQHGSRGVAEVDRVRMEDFDIVEVVIDDIDEAGARCLVYLSARLQIRATVTIEPEQIGEDDWDGGYHGVNDLLVSAPLVATILARVAPDGSVELSGADLNGEKVRISWEEVDDQIG